jgi:hypothetical protein
MHLLQSLSSGVRRRVTRVYSVVLLLVALLFVGGWETVRLGLIPGGIPVTGATSGCATSSPSSGAYKVTLCFTSPASGASLTANATVTATASTTGSAVQRMVFYLDGVYLLTDYASPYAFTLPTTHWVDGGHSLSVSALMRDGFTSTRAARSVTFKNGITSVPRNTNVFKPTAGRTPASGTPFVVAAAGDGASGQPSSASVVSLIKKVNPNLLLYLGDTYEKGSPTEFFNWYGGASNFGALRSITDPTVGNHEYLVSGANGYYDYWDNVPKYYSFNAYGWHFVSLNSNSSFVPTSAGSAQYNWLKSDLARLSPNVCTIVFYHHPYFNIGPEGPGSQMSAIWQLMAQYHVDIVLNGHDHDYQRWKPLNGSGAVSSQGITEFVVGSSGHGLQTFVKSDSRVAYKNDANPTAFGALFLTLHSTSASFKYENTNGSVLDQGTVPCVSGTAAGPTATATVVSQTLTLRPAADAYVDWSRPSSNFGTATFLRTDGSPVQRSYLRFSVQGLDGRAIKRVRLLLHANSSFTSGLNSSIVSSNSWGETTINYSNMPALGSNIASVTTASSGQWVTFDVTSYVKAAGTYSFAITTTGSTSISLASRESGTNSPKLIVDPDP